MIYLTTNVWLYYGSPRTTGTFKRYNLDNSYIHKCVHANVWSCCEILNYQDYQNNYKKYLNSLNNIIGPKVESKKSNTCFYQKHYESSPYEIEQILKAKDLDAIEPFEKRREAVRAFVGSPEEIAHSGAWLERVDVHRSSPLNLKSTKDDHYYLSRFIFTKVYRNYNIDSF
jgi:hypothetical protein